MDKQKPAIVARVWTEGEASVIKSLLESYGVPCYYSSELPHRIYPAPGEELGKIRIFAPQSLAQEAKSVLDEHRRSQPPPESAGDEEL